MRTEKCDPRFDATWEPWFDVCRGDFLGSILDKARRAYPERNRRYFDAVRHVYYLASGQNLTEGHAVETCGSCDVAMHNYAKLYPTLPEEWRAKP